ncbi:hypothetical protein F5141DRAFT_733305 [Pisolithus sp. B1]|nr:hypothetical protein F5141DRAFT_733305 [Pisolithus sp. B1]
MVRGVARAGRPAMILLGLELRSQSAITDSYSYATHKLLNQVVAQLLMFQGTRLDILLVAKSSCTGDRKTLDSFLRPCYLAP